MLGMKRAVALMLTAFLLLSALSVSTMASDKAAASGSSEAAYFDRLLETAPIDEAASDIGADKEVETVQEYEKGAGDGTGALFGCEAVAGDEADTIYESETGAGDETGALFGYGDGGESVGTDEEQDALAEIPAMAAAPEETGSEAEEENTAGEDYVDDLTGEMAGTAYDGGEMPGGGIPADELYGKEPGAEKPSKRNPVRRKPPRRTLMRRTRAAGKPSKRNPVRRKPARRTLMRRMRAAGKPSKRNPVRKKPARRTLMRRTLIRRTRPAGKPSKRNPVRKKPVRTEQILTVSMILLCMGMKIHLRIPL